MAFKLGRKEHQQLSELADRLRDRAENFESLREEKQSDEDQNKALAELLVVINEAEEFRNDIATRLRDEYEDKSDNWQESDRGSDADAMIEEWESAEFVEPDVSVLADVELEDYADILENLPTEI